MHRQLEDSLPLSRRKPVLLFAFIGGIIAVFATAILLYVDVGRSAALIACNLHSSTNERTECAYALIDRQLNRGGVDDAMRLWIAARRVIPDVGRESCHRAAHRVGDLAYFNHYVAGAPVVFGYSFDSVACDFGFYHGYYEHVFQDKPDPNFIAETCSALPDGPSEYQRTIRMTCFHGGGHGLVLAQADRLRAKDFGNIHAFADWPLSECKKLTGVTDSERRRCVLGIFAETAQFQYLKEYGFFFETPHDRRFSLCSTFDDEARLPCTRVTAVVSVKEFGEDDTMRACDLFSDDAFLTCMKGAILGLYIDGAAEEEFTRGLNLCAGSVVQRRAATVSCYAHLAYVVATYYASNERKGLCSKFPEKYLNMCLYTRFTREV